MKSFFKAGRSTFQLNFPSIMSSTTTARRLEAELAALGGSLRTRSKRTRTVAISTWARSSNPSIVDLTFLGGSHHQHPSDVDFDQEEYDGKYIFE